MGSTGSNNNSVSIRKDGKKWVVLDSKGKVLFQSSTRVAGFRYAADNNLKITGYQHGGK